MMLKIVTDGGADFPDQWQDLYQIYMIPLRVQFGERTYIQGLDISTENFYELVKEHKMIPKTSLPSPGQIMDFYRGIANRGDEVLSVHLGSKFSGTFATVQLAAKELIGEIQVYPFDSGAGSAAQAMMCREARLLDQADASINDILKKLEIIRERLRVVFTLDTLDFARMNGRVNAMQSVISSAFRIKPIVILRDGLLQMADRVRTRQRAIEQIIDYARSQVGASPVDIAVVHAADPQMAQWLMEKVRQVFNCHELIATELSIPVAANLGPGAVGIIMYAVE
jgi:DegV family protein with EDD domain